MDKKSVDLSRWQMCKVDVDTRNIVPKMGFTANKLSKGQKIILGKFLIYKSLFEGCDRSKRFI